MLKICEQRRAQSFATMQLHLNLLYREEEREMIPLCEAAGVGVLAWSPLARGLLARGQAGKETARSKSDNTTRQFYSTDADGAILSQLSEIATARGVLPAQIALSWLLHRGVTAPIIGASKPHHIDDACGAASLALSADEIARLEKPYQSRAIVTHG
jgi:aryl-alcohol dehydrogenase-like predicted oxidoreductase